MGMNGILTVKIKREQSELIRGNPWINENRHLLDGTEQFSIIDCQSIVANLNAVWFVVFLKFCVGGVPVVGEVVDVIFR